MTNGWFQIPLHYLVRFGNGQNYDESDESGSTYPVIGSGGEFARTSRYLYDGESVLFGRKGTVNRPLYVSGRFWTVDTMYYTVPGPLLEPKWLYYWATTISFDLWSTNTALPSMTSATLGRLKVPVPSRAHQRQLVQYLDGETGKIDALIAKQRQLVKELDTRRRVAIFSAVTRGLRETATQDTGFDWLKDVPAHWDVVRLNRTCQFGTGNGDSHEALDDGEYPFFLRSQAVAKIDRWNFDGEAVMTAGDGQGGVGKVFHYYNGRFDAHQRVYIFRNFRKISAKFFYYYLRSVLPVVVLGGTSDVTMASLRRPLLSALRVTIPPQQEQQEIVEYCERQEREIDNLIAKSERLIELSQERRLALITAAVTGQIDVRQMEAA